MCFAVAALFVTSGLVAAQSEKFESIFNGRDLCGWVGDPEVWSVHDGAIVGETIDKDQLKSNTFLIWQGGEVGDFELELQFRIHSGNSGIQYRSRVIDVERWIVGGYQGDIEAGPRYTGILYEEQGRGVLAGRGERVTILSDGQREAKKFAEATELGKKIRPREWNDYRIVAEGHQLRHDINGQLMVTVADRQTDKRSAAGILALQVHRGPPMKVEFRNLRLRRFDQKIGRDR